jgi:uncharacterized membrane protein
MSSTTASLLHTDTHTTDDITRGSPIVCNMLWIILIVLTIDLFVQTDSHIQQRLIFGHVITQMSAKSGIERYGTAANDTMMAEFA